MFIYILATIALAAGLNFIWTGLSTGDVGLALLGIFACAWAVYMAHTEYQDERRRH